MKKQLLLLFVALLPLLASAQTIVEIDGIWYNLDESTKRAKVTSNRNEYSGSITIPSSIIYENTNYSVTSIGDWTFSRCSNLTNITIPKSIKRIGRYAFEYCSNLTCITIPESVTSIEEWAFFYCSNLTHINIPKSVSYIGDCAFQYCTNLTNITIPNSVTNIPNGIFYYCTSLTDITIPKGVTRIGDIAFEHCSSLTTITIPEGVTSIGEWAFSHCNNLTTITIPKSVTSIGKGLFSASNNITRIMIADGNNVYDSRNNCNAIIDTNRNTLIAGCSTTIIPEGVISIEDYAFFECTNLTTITFPEGVTSIEEWAFYNCSGLTNINIPKSMTSIADDVFSGCISLTSITSKATTPPLIGGSNTFYNINKSIPVYVPTSSVEVYQSAEGWNEFTNIIGVKRCATPTISYINGEMVFVCHTEGAAIKSEIKESASGKFEDVKISFIPTYTITAYATKENYEDSDVATLTICWIPCEENHEEGDGILTIPSKPVLISTLGGTITLSGLTADTEVAAYDTTGIQLATATATGGTATLTTKLTTGDIAIVKIGQHSIKVVIK